MRETRSTCPYCGVGCGVLIQSEDNRIVGVRGDPDHPANAGRLCSKGSTLHLTATDAVQRQARLLQPLRRLQRGGTPTPVTWDAALDLASNTFAQVIARHGPDAVGFYISGQLLTEDYYVFNKLAKGLAGTNNIDTNSRLCMSSAVAGYKQTLGADAPPACYDDLRHARTLFIAGSNTAWAHPVLYRRIEDARAARPNLRTVVVDPRRTDTAASADLHLQLLPGTDVMLFNGLLHIMLWEGWCDTAWIAEHTQGFDALKALVRDCTPELVAQTCGLQRDDLFTAARWFAGVDEGSRTPTLSLYCQGLNQSSSGTAKNTALINLHLATAQIGRPGAGPFSLTGQPNAMGGREVGGMANLLSAHRDLSNAVHRAEVAALWGVPDVPAAPGKTAVEMFEAAARGEIKALWIACTNPAHSMPDQATVREALARCEFVVVQDAFATTATARHADLLLPATTWGEKTGTVTNSERCVSRVHAAVAAPGRARHDWAIAVEFAQRLEQHLRPGEATLFPYPLPADSSPQAGDDGAEAIWLEHRESTRGRDLDITGMSYALLAQAPRQWPLREGDATHPMGQPRLYEDGVFPTPDGRARFVANAYKPVSEPRDARHPFSLNTGRLRDQWHGMSRTGTLGRLFGHVAEPALQMHPQDIARRLLVDGGLVQVTSRRGSLVLPLQASTDVAPGQVFAAMHWGSEFMSGRAASGHETAGINALTVPKFCPSSKQPELKHAAVKVLKAELPWQLLAMAWLPEDEVLALRERLLVLAAPLAFASCVPFARPAPLQSSSVDGPRDRCGVLLRAADHQAASEEWMAQIESILKLDSRDVLRYSDRRAGQRRVMKLVPHAGHARLDGFVLAGDIRAESWIRPLLQQELPAQAFGRALLQPGSKPPAMMQAAGRQVCTCVNVSETAILEQLRRGEGTADQRLDALRQRLGCGTQCGSCVPELRRLIATHATPRTGASLTI